MSLSVSTPVYDPRLELSPDQLSLLKEFKQWVEMNAEFYGRSEEEFLLQFLYSCDFNLEQSKTTLRLYYLVRVKHPQWWANRDINHPQVQFLIKNRMAVMLLDSTDNTYPTVAILHVSRFGPDPSILGPGGMLVTCALDMMARQTNIQLNGGIFIFDVANYYLWMFWRAFWPSLIKDMLNSFLYCLPIKVQMVVLVNAPLIATGAINLSLSFLPEVYKNKLKCCRSWNDIGNFIPLEILPVEYGGQAGPIKIHEDAAVNKLLDLRDYILDDNKYGFQV